MPRPNPKIENFLYLFEGMEYELQTEVFKATSPIKFKCEHGHTYIYNVSQLRKKEKRVKDCPHCAKLNKLERNREETGIPRQTFVDLATRSDFTLISTDNFFIRYEMSVVFECNKCHTTREFTTPKYLLTVDKISCTDCDLKLKKKDVLLNAKQLKTTTDNVVVLEDYSVFNVPITESMAERIKKSDWHIIEYNGYRSTGMFQCKKCGTKKVCIPCKGGLFSKHKNEEFNGCKHCHLKHNIKVVEEKIREQCEKNSIVTYFERYTEIDVKLPFGCTRCGNKFEYTWREINGRYSMIKCPACSSSKRGQQSEVYEYVKSLYSGPILYEDYKTIKPLQLDIYLPELKIAIEYCGTMWHSTKFIKDNNYHKNKFDLCQQQGIRLVTIFSDEWTLKKDITKSRIYNLIGLSKKIHARKCEVTPIDNKTALDFCQRNHIQGKGQSFKAYGLYYDKLLVSVMTFSKPMVCKNANGYDYELNRFCTITGYLVVGGASKLFKKFLSEHSNIEVISFCDLRWGTGNVYKQLGMTEVDRTRPNYYYVGNWTSWVRKHRFNYTKQKLLEMFPTEEQTTEFELAEKNGLFRIYDCGHLKFSYKN